MLNPKSRRVKYSKLHNSARHTVELNRIKAHVSNKLELGESFKLRLATDSEYKSRVNGKTLMIGFSFMQWELDCDLDNAPRLWLEDHNYRSNRPRRWFSSRKPNGFCPKSRMEMEQYPDVLIADEFVLNTFLPVDLKVNLDLKRSKKDDRPVLTLETAVYFAPSDVVHLFPKPMRPGITEQLEQNGAIANKENKPINLGTIDFNGVEWVVQFKVLDIAKEGPPGGLKSLVKGIGHTMETKGLMDAWKSRMDDAYMRPYLVQTFLEYAIGDTLVIPLIHREHQKRFKALGKEIGLTMSQDNREYTTMGSMISDLTMLKIHEHCKLPNGNYPWELMTKRRVIKGEDVLVPYKLPDLLKFASVKYLAGKTSTTKAMLAIVNGGLAKNLSPIEIVLDGFIADWDQSGAYAACQQAIDYCIGIPHTYGLHENSKLQTFTLGKFLNKYGSELLQRKWVISVSGNLNHNQTLVPSKIVTEIQINNYAENDAAKIPGDFCLLGNEVVNGIITSDILNILVNLCNQREIKAWMDLKVVAAAWYPKSHQCSSVEEWSEKIGSCDNSLEEVTKKDGTTYIKDTRSKHWYSMPLSLILDPWIEARSKYKDLAKQAKKAGDKVTEGYYNGLQSSMKLGNNTNYGVQASPVFEVGNVVTANNITALCRAVVWTAAMAVNAKQVITDGGAYEPNNVRLVGKKDRVGMNTLCLEHFDSTLLQKDARGQFNYGSMGGKPWHGFKHISGSVSQENERVDYYHGDEKIESIFESHKYLDDEYTKHVKQFWLELTETELECHEILKSAHKHVYPKVTFHSQTNYSFTTFSGEQKIKARGHQLNKEHHNLTDDEQDTAPYKKFITDLGNNPKAVPLPKPCTIPTILKINAYNNMGKKSDKSMYWDIDAGDSIDKSVFVRPISLSMFLFKTWGQREAWYKRVDRLKFKHGWGLEQYFLNDDGTLNYEEAVKRIHEAISAGENWIRPTKRPDELDTIEHPYLEDSRKPASCPL